MGEASLFDWECDIECADLLRLVLTIGRAFCLFLKWYAEFWKWMNWYERLKGEYWVCLNIGSYNKIIKILKRKQTCNILLSQTASINIKSNKQQTLLSLLYITTSLHSKYYQIYSIFLLDIINLNVLWCMLVQQIFTVVDMQQDLFVKLYLTIIESVLMDQEAARAAAKRLYQKINFSGGPLQSYQISSFLTDTYEYLKIPYKPTTKDIKEYTEVLDVNKDGQVTIADLEALAIQYLCGPGVLAAHSFDNAYKKPKYEVSNVSTSYTTSLIKTTLNGQQSTINPSSFNRPVDFQTPTYQQKNENSPYNSETLKYLAVTRQIFQTYADGRFTITANEVPTVLSKTYETLGRKGYKPNEQDVRVWMKLCDGNGDGHVQYEQYEYFVVRSLQRSGVSVYK